MKPLAARPHQILESVNGARIPVRLVVNPRARRISVRIDATRREAVAVSPTEKLAPRALAFAAERAGWIAAQLERLPHNQPFRPGVFVPIRGVDHLLEMVQGRGTPRREVDPPRLIVPVSDPALFAARVQRWLTAEARKDLLDRVAAHADTIKARYTRVTVKDTRSRWGSCSAEGALAFSWRVILAPPFVLDYLAAHEVAHLKEMNHSARFWALVRKCLPTYTAGKLWLRRHGAELHGFGGVGEEEE
jgi:hypothetical protein